MLTPLRFEQNAGAALYGRRTYYTDCGRFEIARNAHGRWTVKADWEHEYSIEWSAWLRNTTLADASFETRKAAVRRLTNELENDEVYNATEPNRALQAA